jgi:hypothetical protein
MGHINEPLKEWAIVCRYKLGTKEYSDSFRTIAQLRLHFHRHPAIAAFTGYGNKEKQHGEVHVTEASLEMWFIDGINSYTKKEFSDVFDFVNFLKEHPALAKVVEYKSK